MYLSEDMRIHALTHRGRDIKKAQNYNPKADSIVKLVRKEAREVDSNANGHHPLKSEKR